MKTTKPIATVSYNSVGFLIGVLDRLVENEILDFYAFIEHQPEEDENKAHCHVFMLPAKPLDTLWLRKQFQEPDPTHPKDPLGCLPIGKSKFVDWYWYGLHDMAYLASKNQSRKYHYEDVQMITNDTEMLAELVRQNPNPKAELLKVIELVMKGYKPLQIAIQLNVPTRNLEHFLRGFHALTSHFVEITDRDGRISHEGVYQLPEEDGGTEGEKK